MKKNKETGKVWKKNRKIKPKDHLKSKEMWIRIKRRKHGIK